ncbi:unnamed protein product [Bursaphelenchus okinawaensis]|uniref:Arrestin C-terminal-like domain-containing protein n=1 Tax=Bursaphelenchus okinawaensis TaxID=465554 RepID=A0A811KD27_9BILA|nr:unnamed protein product [Bursaphelenchus okinawaensis]CAG9100786.1 unnamed protein product [Bursaphelenchus okinawaensis]
MLRQVLDSLPDFSGMDVLRIELDNPNGWFYPGSFVAGTVIIRTSDAVKARAVEVIFQGKAKTSWYVSESYRHDNKTHTENVLYQSEVFYANDNKCLWAPPPGQKHLPVGEMRFRFQFPIPTNAPPTFEGTYGFIRYFIKVKIDRPWRIDNRHQIGFTVLPHFDLNSVPYSGYPLLRENHKEIGCCCFKHGRLMVRLIVPKSGFVPGELIPIRVEIQNHATKGVKKISTQVNQIQHFTADRRSNRILFVPHLSQNPDIMQKHYTQVVAQTQKVFNEPRTGNWTFDDVLQMTPVVPSFNICQIIQVQYTLTVKVSSENTFSNTVECEVPMLVGSIPVRNIMPMPAEGIRTGDTLVPPQPSAPPPDYEPRVMSSNVNGELVKDDPNDEEKAPNYKPQYFYYPPNVENLHVNSADSRTGTVRSKNGFERAAINPDFGIRDSKRSIRSSAKIGEGARIVVEPANNNPDIAIGQGASLGFEKKKEDLKSSLKTSEPEKQRGQGDNAQKANQNEQKEDDKAQKDGDQQQKELEEGSKLEKPREQEQENPQEQKSPVDDTAESDSIKSDSASE